MAGFINCQSRSSDFVIVIKSLPKKTPLTPSKMKSLFAKGESADSLIFWKKAVPSFITTLPGKYFKV